MFGVTFLIFVSKIATEITDSQGRLFRKLPYSMFRSLFTAPGQKKGKVFLFSCLLSWNSSNGSTWTPGGAQGGLWLTRGCILCHHKGLIACLKTYFLTHKGFSSVSGNRILDQSCVFSNFGWHGAFWHRDNHTQWPTDGLFFSALAELGVRALIDNQGVEGLNPCSNCPWTRHWTLISLNAEVSNANT